MKKIVVVILMMLCSISIVRAQSCETCTIITPTVWTPITASVSFEEINAYVLSATTSLSTTHTSATSWINNITLTVPVVGAAWYSVPVKYVRMLNFFKMFQVLVPFMLSVMLFRLFVDYAVFVADNLHKMAEVIRWVIDFILQLIDILIPLSIVIVLLSAQPVLAQVTTPTPPDPAGVVPLLPTPAGTLSASLQMADWWRFGCYDVNETAKTFFIGLNAWHLIDGVLAMGLAIAVYEYVERRAAPWLRNVDKE